MTIDPSTTGIILAGGLSRRMGYNKAKALLNGQTLLERAIERLVPQVETVLISSNEPLSIDYAHPQLRDSIGGHVGPLGGILTGLNWLEKNNRKCQWLLSVSVDTPFYPLDLYNQLSQYCQPPNKLIVAKSDHRLHPTCALWHTSLLEPLQHFLEQNHRRMMDFIKQQPSASVSFDCNPADPFSNINTQADLSIATALTHINTKSIKHQH